MTDYTANDLEREVLDPLFYRYERSIRAQVRLERQVADLKARPDLVQTVADQRMMILGLEATVARLQAERRGIEPRIKALYDNAKDLLVDLKVARVRRGTRDVIKRIEKALDDLFNDVEIPF